MGTKGIQIGLSQDASGQDQGHKPESDESLSTFTGLAVAVGLGLTLWAGAILIWWAL